MKVYGLILLRNDEYIGQLIYKKQHLRDKAIYRCNKIIRNKPERYTIIPFFSETKNSLHKCHIEEMF